MIDERWIYVVSFNLSGIKQTTDVYDFPDGPGGYPMASIQPCSVFSKTETGETINIWLTFKRSGPFGPWFHRFIQHLRRPSHIDRRVAWPKSTHKAISSRLQNQESQCINVSDFAIFWNKIPTFFKYFVASSLDRRLWTKQSKRTERKKIDVTAMCSSSI